jgi:hypothetical protein
VLLALVFAVTLGIVVAKQMSAEAMAVVIGVGCGVLSGIPTSMLMLAVMTQRNRPRQVEGVHNGNQSTSPPVVVIQGGTPQALPQGMQAGYWPAPAPGPPVHREFKVVGGEELMIDG